MQRDDDLGRATPDAGGAIGGPADPITHGHTPPGEQTEELLQLIEGSPEGMGVDGWAEQIGNTPSQVRALIDRLIADGRLVRDGERLVVVERRG